jgi:hypothetical protein
VHGNRPIRQMLSQLRCHSVTRWHPTNIEALQGHRCTISGGGITADRCWWIITTLLVTRWVR